MLEEEGGQGKVGMAPEVRNKNEGAAQSTRAETAAITSKSIRNQETVPDKSADTDVQAYNEYHIV